jgi:NADPH2:quinone reductase
MKTYLYEHDADFENHLPQLRTSRNPSQPHILFPKMSRTMLEAHVDADTSVTLHRVPVPTISESDDMIVRVVCASCNPKDWKMPAGFLKTISDCPNSGDDLSGVVEAVGPAVTRFKPGDHVAALHQLGAPHGVYAEYALVKDFVCFHIPGDGRLSWEAAATIPMAVFMACIALFSSLKLCAGPWDTSKDHGKPLLVYGATTGVGSMAVKLAQIVNIHPVICVAGKGQQFVQSLIDTSKGDVVLDYRKGNDELIRDIKAALGDYELEHALDAVTGVSTISNITSVLKLDGGKLALVLPGYAQKLSKDLQVSHVMAGSLWKPLIGRKRDEELGNLGLEQDGPDFARKMACSIEIMLADGKITAHPFTVLPHGLESLEEGLKSLKAGNVSASRFVLRIANTPNLQQS